MATLLDLQPRQQQRYYSLSIALAYSAGAGVAGGVWRFIEASVTGITDPALWAFGGACGAFAASAIVLGPMVLAVRIVQENHASRVEQTRAALGATQPTKASKTPAGMDPIPGESWRDEAQGYYSTVQSVWRKIPANAEVNQFDLHMWQFAHAYQSRQSLSPRKWPAGKPLEKRVFDGLLEEMAGRGWVRWCNWADIKAGREFTGAGKAVMRYYLSRHTPPPW